MSRTENIELTVLCLISQGTQILLQNRIKQDWKGYTLPGGHVEEGESIVEAVIREMKEETGLTISNPRLCGVKQFPIKNGRYLVFLFQTGTFSGELRSSEEGKMEWVDRDRLSCYQTVEDLEELLNVLESDAYSEFQEVVNDDDWEVIIH